MTLLNWLDVPHSENIFLKDLPDLVNVTAGDGDGGYEGGAGEELWSPLPHVPDLQGWSDITHSWFAVSSYRNLIYVPHSWF